MTVRETTIPGLLVIEPRVFEDARGFFLERFHAERYAEIGVGGFVQENYSRSQAGVVRGLHFQRRHPQGKLVEVVRGRIWDVAVDLRPGSATFGQWEGVELDDASHRQLWVPAGFAHGFCVLSDVADVLYSCTDVYRPGDEGGVAWDDSDLGIEWPVDAPVLSAKDLGWPRLAALDRDGLPDAPAP
ncbi:dTDP-4-dehydrorhamnose 3,5-epimerase [Rubrivirga sp.]|uniref:dTDP-4-dehydrorhamnose 3,5-epimerase n=1 Tax=Rubrivirga sp. TaxID=1885344 RepID=UPI003B51A811